MRDHRSHVKSSVVIIGGGISGMCAAIDLVRTGTTEDIVILEKSAGFGGTWRDARFPGSCCDVIGHLYSYSFEQTSQWTRTYPGQEEMLQYLMNVARKYDLYKYVRFTSEVSKAVWDPKTHTWHTTVKVFGGKESEYGEEYVITSNILISAVGQLNYPKYPNIEGLDSFKGKAMHSARWDWSCPLEGQKIAVIGTGSTAAQIIPEVAKVAAHVTVTQRSPGWVVPRHDIPIPPWQRALLSYLPVYSRWYRASWMKIREDFFYAVTQADSQHAAHMREANQNLMRTQLPDRPDLWKALTPDYLPGCKRSIVSDDYYPSLIRPNVTLETRPIRRITPHGILFEDQDSETEVDIVVLATGYQSLDFMYPIEIIGRHGRSLSSIWAGKPQAHKGITVEDMPNFGCLYGPGTNLTFNSQILCIESESKYITAMAAQVLQAQARRQTLSLLVKPDRLASYNEQLQATLQKTSFADAGCTSWWKTDDGVIANNWSGTTRQFQDMLDRVDWTDFEAEGSGRAEFLRKTRKNTFLGRVREEDFVGLSTIASSLLVLLAGAGGFWMRRMGVV